MAPYRLLFYSAAIVVVGVMGQAIARSWLARELTGSNAGLGGVLLVFGVAMLVATPAGGVAADRYPRRLVILASILALMASSLVIGIMVVADLISYWMLLVAGAVQATAFAFYLPSRIALIAELVPAELIQNAIVLSQMSQEAARVVAPAIAGVLIGVAWFGVGGVFIASGVSIALAALFVLPLPRVPARNASSRSPVAEFVDAGRYMRAHTDLGSIALLTVGIVMVGFPYLTFLPSLADERFGVGAGGFGVMSGAAALGAVVAGLTDATLNRGTRPWRTIGASGAAFGLTLIALGYAESYLAALLALAGVGASGLLFQTSTQALMLRISAIEYHGRLQSTVILGFSGFGLAALPLGLLADATSVRFTLTCMGVAVLLMAAGFSFVRVRKRRRARALDFG